MIWTANLELRGGVQPAHVLVEALLVFRLAHSLVHRLNYRSTTCLSTMQGGQVRRASWGRSRTQQDEAEGWSGSGGGEEGEEESGVEESRRRWTERKMRR